MRRERVARALRCGIFTGASCVFPVALALPAAPLDAACPEGMKVNFFGDYFVSPDRFRKEPFAAISPLLEWADFNVVNFEGSITKKAERAFPDMPFALRMTSDAPRQLVAAGIRHVTRGNNHTMDFGVEGMRETSTALKAAGVHFVGVGEDVREAVVPLVLRKGKTRVAVLSFTTIYPDGAWATLERPGVAYPLVERLATAVSRAVPRNDFVVTSFHWGGERITELRDYQPSLAKLAIAQGAALVVGHHAHIAQGFEILNGVPVAWGLGNFLFTSYGKGEALSLGLSAVFCPSPREVRWAFVPILTGAEESMFAVRPMDAATFRKMVAPYVKGNLLPLETKFFLLPENRTLPLAQWLGKG